MKLRVLFGQRTCSYDGEYAPESLEVACDSVMDSNPDWIWDKKDEHINTGEFETVELIEIEINDASTQEIYDRITKNLVVTGGVVVRK
jgi:hypothetical protein